MPGVWPRPARPSVRNQISTTTIHPQCPLPDLNHDLHAQCSLPVFNDDHPRCVVAAGPQLPCQKLCQIHRMSGGMPNRISKAMPNAMSEASPDGMLKAMPHRMPEAVPDGMSTRKPDFISNRTNFQKICQLECQIYWWKARWNVK